MAAGNQKQFRPSAPLLNTLRTRHAIWTLDHRTIETMALNADSSRRHPSELELHSHLTGPLLCQLNIVFRISIGTGVAHDKHMTIRLFLAFQSPRLEISHTLRGDQRTAHTVKHHPISRMIGLNQWGQFREARLVIGLHLPRIQSQRSQQV